MQNTCIHGNHILVANLPIVLEFQYKRSFLWGTKKKWGTTFLDLKKATKFLLKTSIHSVGIQLSKAEEGHTGQGCTADGSLPTDSWD